MTGDRVLVAAVRADRQVPRDAHPDDPDAPDADPEDPARASRIVVGRRGLRDDRLSSFVPGLRIGRSSFTSDEPPFSMKTIFCFFSPFAAMYSTTRAPASTARGSSSFAATPSTVTGSGPVGVLGRSQRELGDIAVDALDVLVDLRDATVLRVGRHLLGGAIPLERGDELVPLLVALRDVELGADAGVELVALLEGRACLGVLLLGEQLLALVELRLGRLAVGERRTGDRQDREEDLLHGATENTALSK